MNPIDHLKTATLALAAATVAALAVRDALPPPA